MRSMVLFAVLALLGVVSSPASAQKAELARYQRAAMRGLGRMEEPAAFENVFKGKSPEEARTVGQQLASRGLIRLPAEDLKYRAELMLDFTGRANTLRHDCGRSKIPACIAGVRVIAPKRSRLCGRMKL